MEVISFAALAAGLIIGLGALGACIGIGGKREEGGQREGQDR